MRTIVFIDGQNLFRLALLAWGSARVASTFRYSWPSYDVAKIAAALTSRLPGRELVETRFYTGVPRLRSDPRWHRFWNNKLLHMRGQGTYVYRGRVNRSQQEKGVDVSLAIDLVQATHEQRYDVAIIVSQDSDFGPAVRLSKEVARAQNRMLRFESAYPLRDMHRKSPGIPGTIWMPFSKALYDSCFDPKDYF